MRRAGLGIVVLALAAAVPAVAGAQQPTLSLRQAGDAVVDKPINLVAEGSTVDDPNFLPSWNIRVRAKDGDLSPTCGLTVDIDDGAYQFAHDLATGTGFTVPFTVTAIPPPGRLLVCAWMMNYNDTVLPPAPLYVNVRAPRHRLTIASPRRARRGHRVTVRFSGTAEVARLLLARIARGSTRCGESDASVASTRRLTGVQGVPPGPINLTARTPALKRGSYTVCAYIQKTESDAKADKVARRVIRVR